MSIVKIKSDFTKELNIYSRKSINKLLRKFVSRKIDFVRVGVGYAENENSFALIERVKKLNTIAIINKSDLQRDINLEAFKDMRIVKTSAKMGEGYEELSWEIAELTGIANLDPDSAVLMGERQRACAQRALDGVSAALEALLCGCTMDAVGVCVDDAISALFELTGKRVTNEVTDEIFRRFCVGK